MTNNSGPIAAARADLADILTRITSIPVLTSIPERLAPPCVVVTEGTPLVAFDETRTEPSRTALDHGSGRTDYQCPGRRPPGLAVDSIVVGMVREGMFAAVDAYQTIKGADGQAYLAAPITTSLTYTIEKDS